VIPSTHTVLSTALHTGAVDKMRAQVADRGPVPWSRVGVGERYPRWDDPPAERHHLVRKRTFAYSDGPSENPPARCPPDRKLWDQRTASA
jgi:hypothetical protein